MAFAKSIALGICAGCGLVAALLSAQASQIWMTEQAMRAELVGKTVDGHFRQGPTWTLTYFNDSRIDQHYPQRQENISGSWFFRGPVFCSLPDRVFQPAFRNSCWTVVKASGNCYEFFRVRVSGEEPTEQTSRETLWYGRAWRQSEPSTCQDKPTV